jgi:hypothetical protein
MVSNFKVEEEVEQRTSMKKIFCFSLSRCATFNLGLVELRNSSASKATATVWTAEAYSTQGERLFCLQPVFSRHRGKAVRA